MVIKSIVKLNLSEFEEIIEHAKFMFKFFIFRSSLINLSGYPSKLIGAVN